MITTAMLRWLFSLFLLICLSAEQCETKIHIRPVTPRVCHPEEPYFDALNKRLIFADQFGQRACIFYLTTSETHCLQMQQLVGPIVPLENEKDRFLLALGTYLVILHWDGYSSKGSYVILQRVEADWPGNFLNDGKTDVKGRFWIGSQSYGTPEANVPEKAHLYSYTTETCGLVSKLDGVSISNGLTWNGDNTIFYYIDSYLNRVDRFDFDATSGAISNRRLVFDFIAKNISCFPHGMTIDTDDNLWIACGSLILKVDPRTGTLLQSMDLAVSQVIDAIWGGLGTNLDILYVTTSQRNLTPQELAAQPLAGYVLEVTGLNATGRPGYPAKMCRQALPVNARTGCCQA